ncbi:hypothetical protein LRAMOSA08439 [Lichtheimia ramosa]|uniref:HCP-like protein n=1 Tax=Lichtheimia ramosa TaxID=688394 RepID=A0A077WE49_9FUNG|nr:hypothetical protein LRAMOSA08439 [Lichtheimia ramosa]
MFRSRKHTPNTDPKRRFSLLPRSFSGFLRSKKSIDSPAPTLPPAFITDDSSITDSSRSVPASPLSAHTAATLTSSIAAESGCYFGPPPPPTDSIQPPFGVCSSSNSSNYTNHQHYRSLQKRQGVGGGGDIHAANDSTDHYLQLGMQCHEKGELEKATYYWRLSAENDSPLGLFFYGIALRHGWGCKKNPAIAVRYLQKAAECAVYDLQTGIVKSTTIAKSELILAIYELGVCFRHGWGVPKNLTTASYYFHIAANLGDPDAQNDLAFCYAHGHGVKKDPYKAAMYYRKAERQGHGIVGNSWIWKDKYSIVDDDNWDGSSHH